MRRSCPLSQFQQPDPKNPICAIAPGHLAGAPPSIFEGGSSAPMKARSLTSPFAAAPPQTTPPPPPPKHSTTSPAPPSATTPQNRIASASTHAIPCLHRPGQSPPATYSPPPYNSSPH